MPVHLVFLALLAVIGSVGIILLSINPTIADDELERIVHEATATALVLKSVALHELLLAERGELLRPDGVDALDRAGGRESPARTAHRLVLDLGYGILLAPVHLGREVDRVGVPEWLCGVLVAGLAFGEVVSEVVRAVLLVVQVGQRIHAQPVAVPARVVLQYILQVLKPDGHTASKLDGVVGVSLAVLGNPLSKMGDRVFLRR
mmetsp:Transcript_29073/g.86083  ORF Transcript_29073/g.86083 Transcript_29073/m.86083 type:complete len:204 (-) Transcript_29073:246-857(-)